jgi:hypothetical protein
MAQTHEETQMSIARRFNRYGRIGALLPLALLWACASVPTGPSVAVLPAPGKPLEVFQAEDQACRAYSAKSAGANANDAAAESVVGSAVVGTALGAAAGALIGGHNGVGTGAGIGLVAGTAVGANRGSQAARTVQERYDIAYEQCMYAKGNQLPPVARARYPYGP